MRPSLALICILGTCALPLFAGAQSSSSIPGTLTPSSGGSPAVLGPSAPLAPVYSAFGQVRLSIDALGNNVGTGLIQVEKAPGATVRAAFLAAASTGGSGYSIPDGDVAIEGSGVSWDTSVPNAVDSNNHLADVTSIVAPLVDAAPPGIVDLNITELTTFSVEGVILAVVFDDATLTTNLTAVIFFGAQDIAGDTFTITLADPAQPTDPNYKLDLSLGISYGFQKTPEGQVSLVDVNATRMTSSAGGEDDGTHENGGLITAGGIGDVNTNPADPNGAPDNERYDDELYDLKPFVNTGDTVVTIDTVNPSNDDNILFAGLLVSGGAVVGNVEPFCFGDGTDGPCPCSNDGAPGNGCANSDHPEGAQLFATGAPNLSNDTLVLNVVDQHASALTLFWQGDREIAPMANGDGLRCVNNLKRLYRVKNQQSESVSVPPGTGTAEELSISQQSAARGDPLTPGAVRAYFATFRDPPDFACLFPATHNNTNALRVTWAP